MKRLSLEDFIEKARIVHGDKYSYDTVTYVNNRTKVRIMCAKHGVFEQTPRDHLCGKGCIECGREKTISSKRGVVSYNNRKPVCGVGVNDYDLPICVDGCVIPSYVAWNSMIKRCYSVSYQNNGPSYIGCSVCEEWLYFSNFKEWFDSPESYYKDGYELDKDILVKGNKIYSPETCVYVPKQINSLFCSSKNSRGVLPIGVARNRKRFYAYCRDGLSYKYLGNYPTASEAFSAYKTYKENRIKSVAEQYYRSGKIPSKVYNAMIKYTINQND